MATTKRTPAAPGEADKLIAHQARLLKAPRIAAHYHRLAEQGRAANWSLEDYLGAVLAVESNARAESGARQRIRYAGFPAIKTITDFDFTAQPAVDRAQIARLESGGWLAEARNIVLLGPPVINGWQHARIYVCDKGVDAGQVIVVAGLSAGVLQREGTATMAYPVAVCPAGGQRTWTVLGEDFATVAPVEEWIEAHRHLWSPNTVRGYATSLAQWWSFLEQRGQTGAWCDVGVPAFTAFLSWQRNGRTIEHQLAESDKAPSAATLEVRFAALISFYRWHDAVSGVVVAGRLLRGTPRHRPARGLLAHLDARSSPAASSLVRVRRDRRRDRPPLLLPEQIQAILDGCAVFDVKSGSWRGNLRDRFVFALLAETGMRLGEALGLRIGEFVLGRGETAYVQIVPRSDNPNGARVKMMRPRRIYVSADLERLLADYLTDIACRAAESGIAVTDTSPLLVNVSRPPLLAALRETTVREKVATLRRRCIGPPGWTPHWFRHTHATALLLAGTPEWVVSRRLGHAHVQTTLDLYGWVRDDEALRAAANWASYASSWRMAE